MFHNAKLVGVLVEDDEERLEFSYSDEWLGDPGAFSLSLALKVKKDSYGHLPTKSFFENLLPEGEVKKILEKKSSDNIDDEFSFLKKYGIDCAGAFVISDSETISIPSEFASKEIKLATLYGHLDKKQSLTSAMIHNEGGRFSLAGAQDKFPVIYKKEKITIPLNGEATTHILKPYVLYLEDTQDSPYNEYFCMKLAMGVGLNVPKASLIDGKYPLYLVERFDRLIKGDIVTRIHEQDFCQAQGLTSRKKYEDEGGPNIKDNYNLIKNNSSLPVKDLSQFINWIWFNLFIGNHDCHSKNLSFVSTPEGLRLSPFYDLLCTVIYKGLTNKFSYSIGKQWKWFDLKKRNFASLAKALEINSDVLFKAGREMCKKLESQLEKEVPEFEKRFIKVKTAQKISKEIKKRITHLQTNISHLKK